MVEHERNLTLTPRTFGQVLDDAFRQYRKFLGFLLVVTAVLYVPFLIVKAYFNLSANQTTGAPALGQNFAQFMTRTIAPHGLVMYFVILAVQLLLRPLIFGSILHKSAQYSLYENELSGREAFLHAVSRWWRVLVTDIVIWLVTVIGYGLIFGVMLLVFGNSTKAQPTAVLVTSLAIVVAFLVSVWLYIRLAFTDMVVIEESKFLWSAIRRSWELTSRSFWRTLGYFLVVGLISGILTGIVQGLLASSPNDWVRSFGLGVVGLFTTPFVYVAYARYYADLRVRTDAPDLAGWLETANDPESY